MLFAEVCHCLMAGLTRKQGKFSRYDLPWLTPEA